MKTPSGASRATCTTCHRAQAERPGVMCEYAQWHTAAAFSVHGYPDPSTGQVPCGVHRDYLSGSSAGWSPDYDEVTCPACKSRLAHRGDSGPAVQS